MTAATPVEGERTGQRGPRLLDSKPMGRGVLRQVWRSGGPALAWGLALSLSAVACAPRALPPERSTTVLAAETLQRVQTAYLYPDRIDRDLLAGALDALEARFDSVRFEHDGVSESGLLRVGDAEAIVPLEAEFNARRYLLTLGQALQFVYEELEEDVEPDEDLELIALQGSLKQLDRYSEIYSGRRTEDFKIRFSGKLSGIGSRIGRRDGNLTAVTVFPDSPAERGGLRDGDWIVRIDGDSTRELTVSDAVDRIRGEAGTRVQLGVQRGEDRVDIAITRGEVTVPSVEARILEPGLGYARILSVSRSTATEFREKLLDLGEIQGLVLDLRGNSGGSMVAAQQLADYFLSDDLIVRVVGRNGRAIGRSETHATSRVIFRMPVVILVDAHTASAAEILAGALAPLRRVTIVGQRTFGKGVVQQVMRLPGESLLKLTVAEYRLSENRVVDDIGIEPDLRLAPIPASRLGLLAAVAPDEIPYVRIPGEDDTFPIDAAQLLLTGGTSDDRGAIRDLANAEIADQLGKHEIHWTYRDDLPDELPAPLAVSWGGPTLTAGQSGELEISVDNPNPLALKDVWIALEAPVSYLSNQIAPIGAIEAGASASARITLTPPEGISVRNHPATIHVASGMRSLHSQEVALRVDTRAPAVEISVDRLDLDEIQVTLMNLGEHHTGPLLVSVPGATRPLEDLAPGAREEVTLRLSADPREVAVTFTGPWARRRIGVPIPEDSALILPPAVDVRRESTGGGAHVRVQANDPDGLEEAWIQLDGQKEAYVAWGGQVDGALKTQVGEGQHDVTVKVEAVSGVSVIDIRRIGGAQPEVGNAP